MSPSQLERSERLKESYQNTTSSEARLKGSLTIILAQPITSSEARGLGDLCEPTTSSKARGSGNLGQDWLTKIPFEVSFRFEVVGLPRSLEPLASLEVL